MNEKIHKIWNDVEVIKNASVVRDDQGNIIGVVEMVTDLTELKRVRKKAEKAMLRLGELHRMDNIIGIKPRHCWHVLFSIKSS